MASSELTEQQIKAAKKQIRKEQNAWIAKDNEREFTPRIQGMTIKFRAII